MNQFRTFNRIQDALQRRLHPPALTSFPDVERQEYLYYLQTLDEGMTVFDVGANVGRLTVLFSRFVRDSGCVHAFEAGSETFKRLQTICDLVHVSNVRLNQAALADKEGTLKLHLFDPKFSSLNSLAARPMATYGIDIKVVGEEDVPATTIDAYCQQNQIGRIDLLKIDVEGAEYQVLRGAQRMLSEKRVARCLFEFGQTTFDMGNKPTEIQAYLEGLGYRISNIVNGAPLFPVNPATGWAMPAMLLAVPR